MKILAFRIAEALLEPILQLSWLKMQKMITLVDRCRDFFNPIVNISKKYSL